MSNDNVSQRNGKRKPPTDDTDAAVRKLNKTYAVVKVGGKTRVMEETFNHSTGRNEIVYQDMTDFELFHERSKINNIGIGRLWRQWSARRQYVSVFFDPGMSPGEHVIDEQLHYNTWRGLHIQPKAGDWSKFRQHIHDNVCNSNHDLYQYVMAWFALGVQQPYTVPGTALVIRSTGLGTGKSIVAKNYAELFGQHGMVVSSPAHMSGRFNGHLEDLCCLVLEEAFLASNQYSEATLKAMITEPYRTVECKGLDARSIRNYLRVVMVGNAERIINASGDERRYCVLDVNERRKQDIEYFAAMQRQLDDGGLQAWLHELMAFDLSTVQIRIPPKTDAMRTQKLLSLTPKDRWWFEKLEAGKLLPGAKQWGPTVDRADLTADFAEAVDSSRFKDKPRSTATTLGYYLHKLFADKPGYPEGGRVGSRFWQFPPLEECRAIFDKHMGDWGHVWRPALYVVPGDPANPADPNDLSDNPRVARMPIARRGK